MIEAKDDIQVWEHGTKRLREAFDALPCSVRSAAESLCREIVSTKETLHSLLPVQAADICTDCGGDCCRSGRYHATAVEILCHFVAMLPLFTPRFVSGRCPYLGAAGCLMEPGLRPYPCVTFNCERIEELLPPEEIERFYDLEKGLRSLYTRVEELLGTPAVRGFLLSCRDDGKYFFQWRGHS